MALVDIRLLGETELRINDHVVDIGHARQRCVLVVLLIEANHTVTIGQLVERVWGAQRLPERPAKVLQSYIALLRRALSGADGAALTRRQSGYRLTVDRDAVDLHRFLDLVKRGHVTDDDGSATTALEQALALWRGEPFADLATPWCQAVRASLAQKRQAAELALVDIRLRAGEHADLVAELTNWARLRPLDERLAGQLMLALYRSGRQADALHCYDRIRRQLSADLGSDPGPALRSLHQQILTSDPTLLLTPSVHRAPAHVVPRELPGDVPDFVGRAAGLAALDRALADGARPRTALVSGGPGVGKSALAVHWAQVDTHRFPDGQLYVDLRGTGAADSALGPAEALYRLLPALGVPPGRIPTDLPARAALYRSLLAERRVLVLLDNARCAEQVRPLLPGSATCRTLITSRDRMPGLMAITGAFPVHLGACPAAEAAALLASRIGRDRAAAEPGAVAELAQYCGGLPLALVNVAVQVCARPHTSLRAMVDELQDNRDPLDALISADPDLDLRTVFSWSCRSLTPSAARLFWLMAVHSALEIEFAAMAGIAGMPDTSIRPLVTELAQASLITECGPARWACHPLLRAYARAGGTARPGNAR